MRFIYVRKVFFGCNGCCAVGRNGGGEGGGRSYDNFLEEANLCIMFHNDDDGLTPKPEIRLSRKGEKLGTLFDNEEGSDVVFLVGVEPDTWRFPGHRSILRTNPVFRAMLEGPLANIESKIVIKDVDGRAFDHLLRYLYREDAQLQSVGTALATLYAANKYLCPELVEKCVRYLDDNMNTETVLQIYQHVRVYAEDINPTVEIFVETPEDNTEQTITDSEKCCLIKRDKDTMKNRKTMSEYCTSLLFNCYQFIDENGDKVLNEECVEDLTRDALYDIVKRDTLKVSSEMVVFSAIVRWCNRECKRCHLEQSKENQRYILGDRLLFSSRYLLMSQEEFISGPMKSGLLEESERTAILSEICKKPNCVWFAISSHLKEKLRRPRNYRNHSIVPLSNRSNKKENRMMKDEVKKEKRKKERKNSKDEGENRCLNYTLNVLACIFD